MITISAGLVILYDNKMLLAHPTGQKWYGTYSIPKGHVEEGEDHLEAAIRETKEEVGLEFNIDETEPLDEGYIEYKDGNGDIYKKVHYFVIQLKQPVEIKKLQKEEINWAGFLDIKEAEKRIFWRFKPLLKYLEKPMKVKLVKESLYEKFSETGDPVHDMGIGVLPEWEKKLDEKYRWERNKWPERKDYTRINDIVTKANGDSAKEMKLAETMCKLMTDPVKAYRRFQAARETMGMNWGPSSVFLMRAAELARIK